MQRDLDGVLGKLTDFLGISLGREKLSTLKENVTFKSFKVHIPRGDNKFRFLCRKTCS